MDSSHVPVAGSTDLSGRVAEAGDTFDTDDPAFTPASTGVT